MSGNQVDNLNHDIKAWGLVVGGEHAGYNRKTGNLSYFWAEVTPSGGKWHRQFLPSVKRWWFEVHEQERIPSDEMGIGSITHAYTKYGSGGAYTLRGCIQKAMDAIQIAAAKADDVVTDLATTDPDTTSAAVKSATKPAQRGTNK